MEEAPELVTAQLLDVGVLVDGDDDLELHSRHGEPDEGLLPPELAIKPTATRESRPSRRRCRREASVRQGPTNKIEAGPRPTR